MTEFVASEAREANQLARRMDGDDDGKTRLHPEASEADSAQQESLEITSSREQREGARAAIKRLLEEHPGYLTATRKDLRRLVEERTERTSTQDEESRLLAQALELVASVCVERLVSRPLRRPTAIVLRKFGSESSSPYTMHCSPSDCPCLC